MSSHLLLILDLLFFDAFILTNSPDMDNQPSPSKQDRALLRKANRGTKTLTKRVHYLIAGQRKKKTSKILLSLAFIIPLLSNSIIFEAWYTETEDTEGLYSEEEILNEGYIIDHGDGTYTFHLGDQSMPLDSPHIPGFEEIKIIKK